LQGVVLMNSLLLEVGVASDQGSSRARNEDALQFFQEARETLSFVVADGMGGHEDGQRAAELAVRATMDHLSSGMTGASTPPTCVESALLVANKVLLAEQGRTGASDMGCTVLAGFVQRGILHTAHLGDVRAMLLRDARVSPITQDHNLWNDQRRLSATEAVSAQAPDDVAPTRALGRVGMLPELTCLPLQPGDCLAICTDGLWRFTGAAEFEEVLRDAALDSWASARRLIDRARNAGRSDDNLSVIVIRCSAGSVRSAVGNRSRGRWGLRATRFTLIGIAAGFAIGGAMLTGPFDTVCRALPRLQSECVQTASREGADATKARPSTPVSRTAADPKRAADAGPITRPEAQGRSLTLPVSGLIRLSVSPPNAQVAVEGSLYTDQQHFRASAGAVLKVEAFDTQHLYTTITKTLQVPKGAALLNVQLCRSQLSQPGTQSVEAAGCVPEIELR
jgi:PPM family protein phosphatase